jgi:heat-inducible transcriptional repressor
MANETGLGKRERDLLIAIVRQHISTGLPVGSKAVGGQLEESLSSATIRKVMVLLETEGYLTQPHTSAGRVPTDKAYRFYVNGVSSTGRLTRAMEAHIVESLGKNAAGPEELLAQTCRLLSEVSRNVGLVLGPALEEKLLEHIKFVKLPEKRVLAVIVSKPDLIENKIIRVDYEVSQEELDRTADYLNASFRGWSLRTVRLEIAKQLEKEWTHFDSVLRNVARLFTWGALAVEQPGQLFVDGTTKILDRPEFEDVRETKELLVAFEEKAKVVEILTACLQSARSGIGILIGHENPDARMQSCAFIVAPFRYRHRAVGAVGVVGPTRMEYERAITTVGYVADLCSRLLSSN